MLEIGSQLEVTYPAGRGRGEFSVLGLRARGGQGFVYSLRSEEGRPAVLKVPSPNGLVGNEVERRILENLPRHRNVIELLGTGDIQGVECPVLAWAHQSPFLRLNDASLEAATKSYRGIAPRTALPATTAIEMTHEVLLALEHMHRLGFVHGDVKSANVMIEVDSPELRLTNAEYFTAVAQRAYCTKLVDFGSTRSTAFLENMDQKDEAVAPSEFTPLFAPPEVFKIAGGGGSRGGAPVDVYQSGLLLYQWISGYPPYDHVLSSSAREGLNNELVDVKAAEREGRVRPYDPIKLKSARQHDVVFAEAFAAQRLRDRFFEDVLAIIDFATSPDPDKRPSVSTLRAEVQRLFELEEPGKAARSMLFVSHWNPRWHLTRVNRLAEAAKVPDKNKMKKVEAKPDEGRDASGAPVSARGRRPTAVGGRPPPGRATGSGAEPRRASGSGTGPIPAATKAAKRQQGLRVALIDDDKVALAILARSLRRRGYLVRTFQDPVSALDAISHDHPNAAIVDMQMPGMTGIELVRELERRLTGRPYPVLVLTSVEDEAVLEEAFRHGVSDYLIKPVTEAELAVKLEKAIERHAEQAPESVPRELAGFELLEEVRRGEVAATYRAADLWGRFPDVLKAVKVLRPDLTSAPEPLLRLRREIDVVAHCNHPGIVRLHLSGLWGRLLFYVTDELPPESLGDWIREAGGLGADETVWVMEEIASALEHLHRQDVVLGELTPESVGRTAGGNLVITELGGARRLGGVPRGDEPMPPSSRYLAPEWGLDPPEVDLRSDLYALGVVAVEAFSGRPPPSPRREGEPLDPRACTEAMPPELAQVVAGLLAPEPERRPQSAGALLGHLSRASGAR